MNILKALEGISAKSESADKPEPEPSAENVKPQAHTEFYKDNVMASVIERHEQISNRVRTGAKRK